MAEVVAFADEYWSYYRDSSQRKQAASRLGPGFSIKDFHSVVLGNG